MTDIDKDQQIEQLKRKVLKLSEALRTIDLAVDRAAAKYLRPVVEYGHLEFSEFLDLLVAEIKHQVRDELKDERKIKNILTKEIERRMEERILELLPGIKGKLSDYLVLPVLIIEEKKIIIPNRLGQSFKTVCRALAVRGNIKYCDGATPEEAYAQLLERFAVEVFQLNKEDMLQRLGVKDMELFRRFKDAEPFKTDEIEGYKIEARIIRGKKADKE